MKITFENLTERNFKDLPEICRGCIYWESPELSEKGKDETRKREYFQRILNSFGNCGKMVYVDGEPAGCAFYGPSERFPSARSYGSSPLGSVGNGVVLLTCLFIPERRFRGQGLGRMLLDEVVHELETRGFKALETFARRGNSNNPSGPVEFYQKSGFYIKDEKDREFPLMRLDFVP